MTEAHYETIIRAQMSNSEQMEQESTYYERNKIARRAYQRAYYLANRKAILRKAQLRSELEPEKAEKAKKYQLLVRAMLLLKV